GLRYVHDVDWLSVYVPAGTVIVLASPGSAFAARTAPRKLQSFAAPVHAVAAGASSVRSTRKVPASASRPATAMSAATTASTTRRLGFPELDIRGVANHPTEQGRDGLSMISSGRQAMSARGRWHVARARVKANVSGGRRAASRLKKLAHEARDLG